MENHNAPAFPPQVAQDNLGRIIAPIPGMSKLEYAAIQLLPFYLKLGLDEEIRHKGKAVNPFQAAVLGATELFNELNKQENEKQNTAIIEQP
jgi:hypothetical protein